MPFDVAEPATMAWALYLAILALAAVDAVVPVVPSESAVIVGAVLAARGDLELALVVVAAAAGALAGDLASDVLGRATRRRHHGRDPGGRLGTAVRWARRLLADRGPGVLVVARFVPGGRTATTFTSGFVGYPAAAFAAIGYLGGRVFEENVLLGVTAGVALGVGAGLVVEALRSRLRPAT